MDLLLFYLEKKSTLYTSKSCAVRLYNCSGETDCTHTFDIGSIKVKGDRISCLYFVD